MENKEFLSYYQIAEAEMKRLVEDFNKNITQFWLKYDLYPHLDKAYSPVSYDGKTPETEHLIYRELKVIQNPIKLLVEVEQRDEQD